MHLDKNKNHNIQIEKRKPDNSNSEIKKTPIARQYKSKTQIGQLQTGICKS